MLFDSSSFYGFDFLGLSLLFLLDNLLFDLDLACQVISVNGPSLIDRIIVSLPLPPRSSRKIDRNRKVCQFGCLTEACCY